MRNFNVTVLYGAHVNMHPHLADAIRSHTRAQACAVFDVVDDQFSFKFIPPTPFDDLGSEVVVQLQPPRFILDKAGAVGYIASRLAEVLAEAIGHMMFADGWEVRIEVPSEGISRVAIVPGEKSADFHPLVGARMTATPPRRPGRAQMSGDE